LYLSSSLNASYCYTLLLFIVNFIELEPTFDPASILYYFSNFESCLRYGNILWGGDKESKNIFKLQKRVLRVISWVPTSCKQIFKDYNVLTLPSLYVLEVVCSIIKHKYVMAKNVVIHNHNTRKELNLHVKYYNVVLFKKIVMNMGISLYNKVPDQTKQKDKFNSFKKGFLLKHSFYSVDELMYFKVLSCECISFYYIMQDCVLFLLYIYSGIVYYLLHVCKLYMVCVWWYCGEFDVCMSDIDLFYIRSLYRGLWIFWSKRD
jgi:hypothetical protein